MRPAATTRPRQTVVATQLPRVAHVVPEYLPRSATFVHTLMRNQPRFEPVVLAERTSNLGEFPAEHVKAHLGDERGAASRAAERVRALAHGFGASYTRWLADEASRSHCVLMHAHFGWSGRDAVAAASRLRIPLVTTFYGRDLSEVARARRRNPYRRLFAAAGWFVVEGPAMAAHLAGIGCDPARIRIVPIGIAIDELSYAPRPRSDRPVVVQTGRFVEKKGFDLGLRAFARALPRLGDAELWLVGDGPLRGELEAIVDELGVRSSVRFAGMVSQAEYRDLVTRADVCIQPSRTAADGDTEGGAPTVILEMQALGVPVVATRHADIPFVVPRPEELIEEEDVDALAEALALRVSEEGLARQKRTDEARAFVVERHAAPVTGAAIETIYDEALR